VVSFKNGALIAIAAGSLFAAACKKEEKKTDKAGETKPADPKAGETKPAAEVKPGEGKPDDKTAAKPDEKTATVNCMGINSCAGKGACATESNSCAGKNGCGGKGFVAVTEEECKAKNGTVMAAKK
jgi:hypothetical protein